MRNDVVFWLCLGRTLSQTSPNRGQCELGTCSASTVVECCHPDGSAVTSANATTILCKCASGDPENLESFGQSMVVLSIVCMVGMVGALLVIFTRSIRDRPGAAIRRSLERGVELVYDGKVKQAKAALISCDPIPSEKCVICLDDLTGDVARPPYCHHSFHRECIETWIDHLQLRNADRSRLSDEQLRHPENTDRTLTCPVCARPILGTTADTSTSSDEEAQ